MKSGTRDLAWVLVTNLVGVLVLVYGAIKFAILAGFWMVIGPLAAMRAIATLFAHSRPSRSNRLGTMQWIAFRRDRLIDWLDASAWSFRNWLGRVSGLSNSSRRCADALSSPSR